MDGVFVNNITFGIKMVEDLRKIKLITPPLGLQKEFIAFAKEIDKSKFEIQQSLEKLETLMAALMQKYFG